MIVSLITGCAPPKDLDMLGDEGVVAPPSVTLAMIKEEHQIEFGKENLQAINNILELKAHVKGIPIAFIVCTDEKILGKRRFCQWLLEDCSLYFYRSVGISVSCSICLLFLINHCVLIDCQQPPKSELS
jgi:hypothetical protein